MPAPFIIPDHIKQARFSLLLGGIPVEENSPAFAALMCAAAAYNRLPLVNHAEMQRQECAQAKRDLERVSAELLAENNRVKRLQAELRDLRIQMGTLALAA